MKWDQRYFLQRDRNDDISCAVKQIGSFFLFFVYKSVRTYFAFCTFYVSVQIYIFLQCTSVFFSVLFYVITSLFFFAAIMQNKLNI